MSSCEINCEPSSMSNVRHVNSANNTDNHIKEVLTLSFFPFSSVNISMLEWHMIRENPSYAELKKVGTLVETMKRGVD